MLLYSVIWSHNNDLATCKGKRQNFTTCFTVLCRSSQDALKCLEYHFRNHFINSDSFSLDDGDITLSRSKIDSRNFNATYMMMDDIQEPIELSDLKSSLLRLSKYYTFYGNK